MRQEGEQRRPTLEGERRGRWIRPVDAGDDAGERHGAFPRGERVPAARERTAENLPAQDDDLGRGGLEELLLDQARGRLRSLAVLERDMEDRIRARWRQAEAEIQERANRSEKELTSLESRARAEAREAGIEARKEGRAEGFREGFEKGAEEGRRLGFEQGRLEGTREGRSSGRREEEARLRREASAPLGALAEASRTFDESRARLLREAQEGVVKLAVEIARKVIQKEVRVDPAVVLPNVERSVEQIFRGCEVILQLHPEDARIVEKVLAENPRWAEDLKSITIRPSPEVGRGGCRLRSGAGVVDLSVESQLELIEASLLRSVSDLDPPGEPPSLDLPRGAADGGPGT